MLVRRLMVGCSLPPGSPQEVGLGVGDQPPPSPVQSTSARVRLRVSTSERLLLQVAFTNGLFLVCCNIIAVFIFLVDESFSGPHPDAHLPLSFIRGKPVYMEVSLLDPPEPDLVLLVHSCLAYTTTPFSSWMLVYDGCVTCSEMNCM